MVKEYKLKRDLREFHMCECSHGRDSHILKGFWSNSYHECEKCECPKYERDPSTTMLFEKCEKVDATMSATSGFSGCVTYYKPARPE